VREDKTNRIYLEHGKSIRFGEDGEKGVRQRPDGSVEIVEGAEDSELLVHDAQHAEASPAFPEPPDAKSPAPGTEADARDRHRLWKPVA
jgi:hypothetical protein